MKCYELKIGNLYRATGTCGFFLKNSDKFVCNLLTKDIFMALGNCACGESCKAAIILFNGIVGNINVLDRENFIEFIEVKKQQ